MIASCFHRIAILLFQAQGYSKGESEVRVTGVWLVSFEFYFSLLAPPFNFKFNNSVNNYISIYDMKGKVAQSCPTLCDPQTIQSMEFSRTEYWSRQPFPSPRDLPNPRIKHRYSVLQADSLPAEPQGKPKSTGVGGPSLLRRIFLTLFCTKARFQGILWIAP